MTRIRNIARLSVALIAFCALVGCGGSTVYPVKGTITFEGKPMKGGGSISFVPTGKQVGKTAGGEIKEDGTYELMTNKPGDGSMTGEFRVVITQVTEQEPENTGDDGKGVPSKSPPSLPLADRIPAIYSDTYQSPLTAKVEAKANVLDFDLKRNAGPPPVQGAMKNNPLRDTFAGLNRHPLLTRPD
ncbi:MAG: hypothetical protein L0241_12105 [Planctomycetia bacterium]|nr:hypothetical protein [Planctomycetia bacterium]